MSSPHPGFEDWAVDEPGRWSKFDRVSVAAAILCTAGVLGIAVALRDWESSLLYIVVALPVALVAALLVWLVRFSVFGRIPSDSASLLPLRVHRLAVYWLVTKLGFAFAAIYLMIAAGVGLVLGWAIGPLIQGFVLIAVAMAIGNMINSCVVNVALIRSGKRSKPQADGII